MYGTKILRRWFCLELYNDISDDGKELILEQYKLYVGMAAQIDMPTATFLKDYVSLPDFLQYWPRLKKPADIQKYVSTRNDVDQEYRAYRSIYETATYQKRKTERFYDVLKQRL